MKALNLKFLKVFRKTHYLGLVRSKLKAPNPVNYFPGFLGKHIKNCPPSKLFLFTSLSLYVNPLAPLLHV